MGWCVHVSLLGCLLFFSVILAAAAPASVKGVWSVPCCCMTGHHATTLHTSHLLHNQLVWSDHFQANKLRQVAAVHTHGTGQHNTNWAAEKVCTAGFAYSMFVSRKVKAQTQRSFSALTLSAGPRLDTVTITSRKTPTSNSWRTAIGRKPGSTVIVGCRKRRGWNWENCSASSVR